LVLLVEVLKEERRGSEEGFGGREEGYKAVRYQLLVLIVEVLKEEGFGEGVRKRSSEEGFGKGVRRKGLEKGFGRGKESYKVVRYQLLVLIEVLIKVLIKVLIEKVLVEGRSFWY
jgi:hypothetical protein